MDHHTTFSVGGNGVSADHNEILEAVGREALPHSDSICRGPTHLELDRGNGNGDHDQHHSMNECGRLAGREDVSREVERALRVLVGEAQVVELRALEVDVPGWRVPQTEIGFFDYDHLGDMAMQAAELSGTARGVYFTLNPVNPALLARCHNRVKIAQRGDPATDADVLRRRWLLVDADPCRPGGVSSTDGEKAWARQRIMLVREYLTGEGWPQPIVADSGNGYHLLYLVDLPADDGDLIKRELHALADRFDDISVKIDRTVHNPSRICKLYGTMACKGDNTPERPHRPTAILELPSSLVAVPRQLLERLAPAESHGGTPAHRNPERRYCPPRRLVLDRARAYLASFPPAVPGNRGHNRTLEAACRLVIGFDLPVDDALPLLLEWNERCQPPWRESELRHKLESANEKPDERGYLLDRQVSVSPSPQHLAPLEGKPFLGEVPDFIPIDTSWLNGPSSSRELHPGRGRSSRWWKCVSWASYLAIWQQKQIGASIPDIFLRQCVYGARDIPAKWRQRISERAGQTWERRIANYVAEVEQRVQDLRTQHREAVVEPAFREGSTVQQNQTARLQEELAQAETEYDDCRRNRDSWRRNYCPGQCPLHGQGIPHAHFHARFPSRSHGVLAEFENGRDEDGNLVFDFDRRDDEGRSLMKQHMKGGRLLFTYLPVLLFGRSPRVNLSERKVRLILALVRETTRKRGRRASKGGDKTEIIEQAMVPAASGRAHVRCPFLDAADRYVGFNGNLRRGRGHGYAIIGQTGRGWLSRAGYSFAGDTPVGEIWRAVRWLLEDLRGLSEPFHLTPVGLARGGGEWKPLDEMLTLVRSESGRRWLNACRLRIYVPDNFLTLWRRWFASCLGFSYIPGGEWTVAPEDNNGCAKQHDDSPALKAPADVKAWLREHGLKQKELATAIGWSPARVSHVLVGRTKWSAEFEEAVNQVARHSAQGMATPT